MSLLLPKILEHSHLVQNDLKNLFYRNFRMGRISLLRNVARQQARRPLVAFSTNFDQKQATFPLFGTLGAAAVTCLLIHKKEIARAKEAEGGEKSEEKPEKPKKFKEKQMRSYENKIRMHSQPDKIFRYFATIASINDGE